MSRWALHQPWKRRSAGGGGAPKLYLWWQNNYHNEVGVLSSSPYVTELTSKKKKQGSNCLLPPPPPLSPPNAASCPGGKKASLENAAKRWWRWRSLFPHYDGFPGIRQVLFTLHCYDANERRRVEIGHVVDKTSCISNQFQTRGALRCIPGGALVSYSRPIIRGSMVRITFACALGYSI